MPLDARCQLLTGDDLPRMRDMLAMFADAFDDRQSYLHAQPDDAYLVDLLSSKSFIAIAAIAGQAVVGGPDAYVRFWPASRFFSGRHWSPFQL